MNSNTLVAIRNLIYYKLKFIITLATISSSIFLGEFNLAVRRGAVDISSQVVDLFPDSVWVLTKDTESFEEPSWIPETVYYSLLKNKDIESIEKLISSYASTFFFKKDSKIQKSIIVGIEKNSILMKNFDISPLDPHLNSEIPYALIPQNFLKKLLIDHTFTPFEINGMKAVYYHSLKNLPSITQRAFIFMSFKNARKFFNVGEGTATFFILKPRFPMSSIALAETIKKDVYPLSALTTEQLSAQCHEYWIYQTGIGKLLLYATLSAILIGIIVATSVLFSYTLDYLKHFSILRLLGSPLSFIAKIIFKQGLLIGILSYFIASFVIFLISSLHLMPIPLKINAEILFISALNTLILTLTACIVSIIKIYTNNSLDTVK